MIIGQQTMQSNINTYQMKQQTLDAGPEFDVALVPASEANTSSTELTADQTQINSVTGPIMYNYDQRTNYASQNSNGVFV